jgi:hypothetical protein
LLEFRWWICGVNSTFWSSSVCLISFMCGESGSIMNTLYHGIEAKRIHKIFMYYDSWHGLQPQI